MDHKGEEMKDLSVYVLTKALEQLPDAGSWYYERGGCHYRVAVPTLLQAVKDKRFESSKDDCIQEVVLEFVAELAVTNKHREEWFDWKLISYHDNTIRD